MIQTSTGTINKAYQGLMNTDFLLASTKNKGRCKKARFLGDLSQMWVGGMADSQTRISPLVFPNLTKTLGWVGGFTHLEKVSKIKPFFSTASLT